MSQVAVLVFLAGRLPFVNFESWERNGDRWDGWGGGGFRIWGSGVQGLEKTLK